jgi:hypothetical protein
LKKLTKVTKGATKLLANIFTLGGLPRLERAKSDYDFKYKRYKKDYDRLSEIKDSVNQETKNIGNEIEGIRILINQSARILECLDTGDAYDLYFQKKSCVTKEKIKSLNTGYSTALSASFGGGCRRMRRGRGVDSSCICWISFNWNCNWDIIRSRRH